MVTVCVCWNCDGDCEGHCDGGCNGTVWRPQEVAHGEARSAELSELINAFILRRTNTLLSAHLPPKVSERAPRYAPLCPSQALATASSPAALKDMQHV